jgi:hypothetical protein
MALSRKGLIFSLVAALWLAAAPAGGVTLTFDYRYDSGNFFDPGTQARATLEAAGSFYSSILNDTLSPIVAPSYNSQTAHVEWTWTMGFLDPRSTSTTTLVDEIIAADEYRIFAGARAHPGTTLAVAAPGNADWGRTTSGSLTSTDLQQRSAIDTAFDKAVEKRDEESGFAAWGGSISFDNDTNWHVNYLTAPTSGKVDLFSVAIHELGHTLGLGTSADWSNLVSGSTFIGATAMTKYGAAVPLSPDRNHWLEGLGSVVYGGAATQTAALTPGIAPGVRKKLTAIDAAALTDIGWSLILPPGLPGDYNGDNIVNAADYTVWRNTRGQTGTGLAADGNHNNAIDIGDFTIWKTNFGQVGSGSGSSEAASVPEPCGIALVLIALLLVSGLRRSRIN